MCRFAGVLAHWQTHTKAVPCLHTAEVAGSNGVVFGLPITLNKVSGATRSVRKTASRLWCHRSDRPLGWRQARSSGRRPPASRLDRRRTTSSGVGSRSTPRVAPETLFRGRGGRRRGRSSQRPLPYEGTAPPSVCVCQRARTPAKWHITSECVPCLFAVVCVSWCTYYMLSPFAAFWSQPLLSKAG
jgi:hypothetical protein